MKNPNRKSSKNPDKKLHPGSSPQDAKAVGGKGDFGVPENDVTERTYASANTLHADPGGTQPHSGANESRISGVGGNNSGPGSSSGGDLDTDIIGIGTGRGVAASGKIHEPPGPDDTTGTSRDFASGPPAKPANSPRGPRVHGSTVQLPDDKANARGADAANPAQPTDNAFTGEVSSSEASGRNDAGD